MALVRVPEVDIVLDTSRCYGCGRWWGIERGRQGQCPVCAEEAIDRSRERADAAERSSRALRGAVTRLAKARRAAR